jgi:hypothetical protein
MFRRFRPICAALFIAGSGFLLNSNRAYSLPTQEFPLDSYVSFDEAIYLESTVFSISIGTSSKCLDAQWAGTTPRTPIQIYECNGTAAQDWRLRPSIDAHQGLYFLQNVNSGLCLDLKWGEFKARQPFWLWDCNYSDAQLFNILHTYENSIASDFIGVGGYPNQNYWCLDARDDNSQAPVWLNTCINNGIGRHAYWWHLNRQYSYVPIDNSGGGLSGGGVVISDPEPDVDTSYQSVPEPSSALGFMAILGVSIVARCKRQKL